jgi:hypothetical protein
MSPGPPTALALSAGGTLSRCWLPRRRIARAAGSVVIGTGPAVGLPYYFVLAGWDSDIKYRLFDDYQDNQQDGEENSPSGAILNEMDT